MLNQAYLILVSELSHCSKWNKATTFATTDTKIYVPVVTLSTNGKVKLLKQLKSGFKITIYWNIYQLKVTR